MLHHARRLQAHGQMTMAKRCVADAIRAIAQTPNASVDQAARQARADNRLREWHIELIREIKALLPAYIGWRESLGFQVAGALDLRIGGGNFTTPGLPSATPRGPVATRDPFLRRREATQSHF